MLSKESLSTGLPGNLYSSCDTVGLYPEKSRKLPLIGELFYSTLHGDFFHEKS